MPSSASSSSTSNTASSSSSTRPNPSVAPVCKVRLRYAKRGKLRFCSHRDVARAFERAIRRAGLPIAYSQGYSPHPKVSWVGAAPTGTASEAEYVELQLVSEVDPQLVRAELDAALPDGLAVVDAVLAGPGGLTERIGVSQWRVELFGVRPRQLRDAVTALLAAPEVMVERLTKDGRRHLDARGAIVSLHVEEPAEPPSCPAQLPECGILIAVVRQVTPAVRPDDVVSALGVVAGLRPPVPVRATRLAQGRLDDDGSLVDPLAPDRAGARNIPGTPGHDGLDQHGVAGQTG